MHILILYYVLFHYVSAGAYADIVRGRACPWLSACINKRSPGQVFARPKKLKLVVFMNLINIFKT